MNPVRVQADGQEDQRRPQDGGQVRLRPAAALAGEQNFLPNARSRARRAASTAGESTGENDGLTPGPSTVTVASMPGGVCWATYSRSAAATSAGSWCATSRNDSFACASLGMMVLPPGPVCPPHMPLTSAVGRAQIRSSVLNPDSPAAARL